jgi:zinc-binding alcohol dehydrogenase/oxidoreductase
MRALVLNKTQQPLDLQHFDLATPNEHEVVVALKAAALNHRDWWIRQGQYAGIKFPTILGSDGAGICEGREVIINPSFDWGDNPRFQGSQYRILGLPDHGTFAEQVIVPRSNIVEKPQYLNWEQAAVIPLAGLTAWRVLFSRCELKYGQRLLISGIGGGVALWVLQLAVAYGVEVWVTSGSDEKIARAIALGAKGGANYREQDWDKKLRHEAGLFHVIIDSAAGEGFSNLVNLCAPGGQIGIYGGTTGKINNLAAQNIFWKQISIHGSTMGNHQEFLQLVEFINRHQLVPIVDQVFPLSEGNVALERMATGAQFGKIVLNIS